jgi:hypothetical protein
VSSRSRSTGFSRKSKAPSFIARVAASTVPRPDTKTTCGRLGSGHGLQDLETVETGHAQVEKHDVEDLFTERGERAGAIDHAGHGMTRAVRMLKQALDQYPLVFIVVGDQNRDDGLVGVRHAPLSLPTEPPAMGRTKKTRGAIRGARRGHPHWGGRDATVEELSGSGSALGGLRLALHWSFRP